MMTKFSTVAVAAVAVFSPLALLPAAMESPAPIAIAMPIITFDQRDFPCQEDEVLGYNPRFGPDKVGCIHIDELRQQR